MGKVRISREAAEAHFHLSILTSADFVMAVNRRLPPTFWSVTQRVLDAAQAELVQREVEYRGPHHA